MKGAVAGTNYGAATGNIIMLLVQNFLSTSVSCTILPSYQFAPSTASSLSSPHPLR
jgi:hypothetical protein